MPAFFCSVFFYTRICTNKSNLSKELEPASENPNGAGTPAYFVTKSSDKRKEKTLSDIEFNDLSNKNNEVLYVLQSTVLL
jgi:hypothetical protein